MKNELTYKVYKKVRVSPHIFTLPLKLFYVFVLGVVGVFSSLLGGFNPYGLFFRVVLLIVFLCVLIECKSKFKKFHVHLGETLPSELNLKLTNPADELNYYLYSLKQLREKKEKK